MLRVGWSLAFLVLLLMLACSSDSGVYSDGDHPVDGDGDSDGDGEEGDVDPDSDREAEARPSIDTGLTPEDLVLQALPDPPSPPLPQGVTIRVMSYNIFDTRYASAEAIGAMIRTYEPDLVGLQECDDSYLPQIAEAAGMEYYDGYEVAQLSKTPLEGFTQGAPDNGGHFTRSETVIDGVRFVFYNAHLDWNVSGNLEFRQFTDEVIEPETVKHLVLTGDFNDEHYSTQNTMLEEVATDVFTTLGYYPGERISWPSIGFDDTEGSQLIDLIWWRNDYPAIALSADVLNLAPVLSDHKPVIADLLYPIEGGEAFAEDPFAPYRAIDRDFPSEDERPPNLLRNPGAEEGLEGWTILNDARAENEREHQLPRSGQMLFTGWLEQPADASKLSSGTQTVDLSEQAEIIDRGQGRLLLSGWLATGYQTDEKDGIVSNKPLPTDEGEMVLEMLDETGKVLTRWSSKRRDTLAWHPVYAILDIPPEVRASRVAWISHHKSQNGRGNDVVFDDLYLGFEALETAHRTLGGNLLQNTGAETDMENWDAYGWRRLEDGEVAGLTVFHPCSFSGEGLFFGGGMLDLNAGEPGVSTLSQRLDLQPYFDLIDRGDFALRWGGWLRTWAARTTVNMALEIIDAEGSVWAEVPGAETHNPEWTSMEFLTRIPPGASAVRLMIRSDVEQVGTGVFADSLFVRPERIESPSTESATDF